jgi:hypothetical protein
LIKFSFFFIAQNREEVSRLKKSDLAEQIIKLNIKIANANKELDELELKYKKKKLEIRKYKNESAGLQLELQELELENYKEIQEQQKIKRIQKETMKKYSDPNNEYYSQEKSVYNSEDSYKSYLERNILPYND